MADDHEFRPGRIAKVLFYGSWAAVLLSIAMLSAYGLLVGALFSDTIRGVGVDVAALILTVCGLVAAGFGGFNWWRERKELHENEHFAILVVLAIYAAIAFGAFNFVISRFDETAFAIDGDVAENLQARAKADLAESEQTIRACHQLADRLEPMTNAAFDRPTWRAVVPFVANGKLVVGDARFYLRVNRGGDHAVIETLSIEVETPDVDFVIAPIHQIYFDRDVKGPGLAKALRERAEWERIHELPSRTAAANANTPSLSAWMFIYQGVMDLFQANPNYAKPVGALARIWSLAYTFCKFAFFTLFLSLIARRFAKAKPR